MQKNSENFSQQQLLQLAQSPAGRELMQLLRAEHSAAMDSVSRSAQAGQMDEARAALAAFFADPKAQALLKKLQEETHG